MSSGWQKINSRGNREVKVHKGGTLKKRPLPEPTMAPIVSVAWDLLRRATPAQIKAASRIDRTPDECWAALEAMVGP